MNLVSVIADVLAYVTNFGGTPSALSRLAEILATWG